MTRIERLSKIVKDMFSNGLLNTAVLCFIIGFLLLFVLKLVSEDINTRLDIRKEAVKANITTCMYNTIRKTHDDDSFIFDSDLSTTLDICIAYEKQRLADLVYDNVEGAEKLFVAIMDISTTEDYTDIFYPVLDMLELSNITLVYE